MTGTGTIGTVVLDLDGVVYLEATPIPGAAEAITRLEEGGWQVLFATNNSTKTPEILVEYLEDQMGLHIDPEAIVTSGMASANHLIESGINTAQVVGSVLLAETLEHAGIAVTDAPDPGAVVVGLDRAISYDRIDRAARAVRAGALFVAANTDPTFPTRDGKAPGTGAMVAAIAAASRDDWVVCGKPHPPMLQLLNRKIRSDRVVMVGDRQETDIAFAELAGWESVLTLSGVTSESEVVDGEYVPDHVIRSIVELPDILDASPS